MKNTCRNVLTCAAVLTGLSGSFNEAASAPQSVTGIHHQVPVCYASDGQRVRFRTANSAYLAAHGASLGLAMIERGRPVVYYDANTLSRYSRAFSKFILYHECGHHALGHGPMHNHSPQNLHRREMEADCYAMQRLMRDRGYRRAELEGIISGFRAATSPHATHTHPSFNARRAALEGCYTRALRLS